MVERVRQKLEKANEKVSGKENVLRIKDGQPAAKHGQGNDHVEAAGREKG
jgi:hypothetical protein